MTMTPSFDVPQTSTAPPHWADRVADDDERARWIASVYRSGRRVVEQRLAFWPTGVVTGRIVDHLTGEVLLTAVGYGLEPVAELDDAVALDGEWVPLDGPYERVGRDNRWQLCPVRR